MNLIMYSIGVFIGGFICIISSYIIFKYDVWKYKKLMEKEYIKFLEKMVILNETNSCNKKRKTKN